jgi:hypothetical protein
MTHSRTTLFASGLLLLMLLVAAPQATSLLGLRYPLGIPIQPDCGMSYSMGGTGTGVNNDNTLMLYNPANLGAMRKTVFSSLLAQEFTTILDQRSGVYTNHARFLPRQVGFGFPLGTLGAVAVSYDKRSDAQMRFEFPTVPLGDDALSLYSYQQTYSRDGGVSAWQVGWGRAIGKWAQIGLSYERVYLRMSEARTVQLTADFKNTFAESTLVDWRGNGVRGGVMVPIKHLIIGVAGEYYFPATVRIEDGEYIGTPHPQMATTEYELRLPPSLRAGLSWSITPSWLVAADAGLTLWDQYYPQDALLSGPLRDKALAVSGGGQFTAGPELLTPKYWETIQWRLGARYTQMPTASAYEWGLTLGTGLPLPSGGGLLDLVLEYGQRRDGDFSRYREDLFRVAVGVNGGRKWARSPEATY